VRLIAVSVEWADLPTHGVALRSAVKNEPVDVSLMRDTALGDGNIYGRGTYVRVKAGDKIVTGEKVSIAAHPSVAIARPLRRGRTGPVRVPPRRG